MINIQMFQVSQCNAEVLLLLDLLPVRQIGWLTPQKPTWKQEWTFIYWTLNYQEKTSDANLT